LAGAATACTTDQSALHPAGADAEAIATLFWIMVAAGAAIWAAVMGCAVYAVLGQRKPTSERFADHFVLYAGVVAPTVLLAGLLLVGLRLLPDWRNTEVPDLRIHVVGEQFWWRFIYEMPDGQEVETANELRLPVGRLVEFRLTANDVIHSFWIPALGGKLDTIPGRTNLLRLRPTKTGDYRGVCAEFCGLSHTLMAFPVVVEAPERFREWLQHEARPAAVAPGSDVFLSAGCGACHTVRGVSEAGSVGPDLTHLAARSTIAAGTQPFTRETLSVWIADPEALKPGARMPGFPHLSDVDREALVTFLTSLQ
jgi:cytochrome c oxidase subunit 2